MAPILKEADAPAGTTTTTVAPASPAAKSPNDAPARPQPVPLEIPVTVNGARTVEGSDKREPFAETTQTVLVFPHGAVIRIATPLAPGQLVFLTNEKTKKEVVCQVVKSKSGGSASGYVELQFTEPAPAFWGLRLPGTVAPPPATAPAVPRPLATVPAPPVAKIPVSQPVAPPVAQIPTHVKPAVAPPAPPVIIAAPPAPPSIASTGEVSLTAALKLPDHAPVNGGSVPTLPPCSTPLVSVPPPSPFSGEAAPSSITQAPRPLIPAPTAPSHDFSKEIESLFAVPQAPELAKPAVPQVPLPPVASTPSTEELKQQATRLQQQLSSMLFTEAPATEKPPVVPSESKPNTPVVEVANKILEITHEESKLVEGTAAKIEVAPEPKPEIKPEPKPAAPARAPIFSSLSAKEEEVEIPAWLRPLSQHSETVAEAPAPVESASTDVSVSHSPAAEESATVDSASRSEPAVFGGQLLSGDSSAEAATTSGSKKGLFIGLAAAAVLLAAGGAWYYRQNLLPSTPAAQTASTPVTVSQPETATVPPSAEPAPSRPVANAPAPSNPSNSTPARTAPATPAPAPTEARRNTEPRNSAPAEEPARKPSLGEVHLATPVVRGSSESHGSGEPLPSIDAPAADSGADALNAVARQKTPAAPLPVGGDVKAAQLIKSVPPVYPQMAKTQRITGNVMLDALIDANGNVAQVKVISGPPLLHQSALEAVKQWKYSPAQLNGSPTAMHLTVTVQFRTQ